jgi:hypothetical protein
MFKNLFGTKTVTSVLLKFSKLQSDLEDVLDFHSELADFHAHEAEVQQKLSIQATNALKAVQTLLGN